VEARPTISKTPRQYGEQLLMSARQAYWNRDYRTSIDRYRQLLNQQPQNPDFNGELGNVYYAMNDYSRAAQQYYRAALLLLDQDQVEAARQLISPITAMDRALDDRLQSRFRQ
jgi:tetratricopeptide (TPR) repeat protein